MGPVGDDSKLEAQTLTRRSALKLIGTSSLLAALASSCRIQPPPHEPDPDRPNIIYLHSHDTGRYLQPYGHDISTPNLQRFADEGVVFKQAFSASPTCSPSRAALLTGMTPGCNGMWGLAQRGHELNDPSQTLVHFLKRAGYTTALAGVQHVADGEPRTSAERLGYDTPLRVRGRLAEPVADAAVSYLESPPARPFFLDIGFVETHTLPLTPDGSHFGYRNGDTQTAVIPGALGDTDATRRDMADYAVSAGVLDNAVGRVLDTLERSGLAQNTLVIITTDHGIPLPGFKSNHTDGGLGVTLMLRGPKGFSGGKVNEALVSQIDLFPTICELLELPPPAWLQGTSLMPLIRGDVADVNEAIYAEHESHVVLEPQASVRTKRYRYVRRFGSHHRHRPANTDNTHTKDLWVEEGWPERLVAPEQLYDLEMDPFEQRNLADAAAYGEVLLELRGLLVARMERYDNPLLRRYDVSLEPPIPLDSGPRVHTHLSVPLEEGAELGIIYTE